MRIANLAGAAVLVAADGQAIDIAARSNGAFGPSPRSVYENWVDFVAWAASLDLSTGEMAIERAALGSPSPAPRQVFAIGLNYGDHAKESGFETPTNLPPVFTKFVSSITGPHTSVVLPPGGNTDWEIELVAVIGIEAHNVSAIDAWGHVAGLTAGQDLSERISQLAGPAAQFGLGKSFAGFAPIGPWAVTVDEFADPDDLELGCALDGVEMQRGRTSSLLFSVPRLIEALSRTVTLYPGDLIFTGTPSGVGLGRTPPQYIQPGQTLTSWIEGIGELEQTFVAAL